MAAHGRSWLNFKVYRFTQYMSVYLISLWNYAFYWPRCVCICQNSNNYFFLLTNSVDDLFVLIVFFSKHSIGVTNFTQCHANVVLTFPVSYRSFSSLLRATERFTAGVVASTPRTPVPAVASSSVNASGIRINTLDNGSPCVTLSFSMLGSGSRSEGKYLPVHSHFDCINLLAHIF